MFLLLSAWAHAAPLVLPAQEDSALWSAPMELHGFERATTTTGARARLVEGEGQWTLIVVDSSGRTHRAQVPAPVTPADREDTLALDTELGVGGGMDPGLEWIRRALICFGKSKAKIQVDAYTWTTFNSVAGIDEAKAELVEIVP